MALSLTATLHLLILLASTCLSVACLEFVYNGFKVADSQLKLDGAAKVTPDGLLQLTGFADKKVGHAFYANPMNIDDDDDNPSTRGLPVEVSFSTTFVFRIDDNNGTKGAQGFAFVFAPTDKLDGANSSEFLGLLGREQNGNSSNHLLAIEFDTFQNKGDDINYIDMPENHVGVDINNLTSSISAPASYYVNGTANESLSLKGGKPIQAWIDYSRETKVLNVTIAPYNVSSMPQMPLISQVVNLTSLFEKTMYVGFSSSTGKHMASSHYIIGWSFNINGTAQSLDLPSLLPHSASAAGSSKMSALEVGVIAVASALALVVLAAVIWYLRQRAKLRDNIEDWELDYPHRFSYTDLYRATKGFNESEVLGGGGFGIVYKGVLPHTTEEVAIKKISSNSSQGLQQFVAEIASLGRMRHRHLVQLRGWCKKNADLLLVYEFMPNGSLDGVLFNKEKGVLLSWDNRFKILSGVALGLRYLHEEFEQVVVHRDVKSGNVLLDADMNGKLSDFGLAKLYGHGQNPQTTRVVGTLGYIAPELLYEGKATECSDVYAYGVVMLEVACGRKAIDSSAPRRELILLDWVKEHRMKGQLLDVADPRLKGCYATEEMELVLNLGLHCCQSAPELRPTMRQVTQFLNGDDKFRDDASLVFTDMDPFDLSSQLSCSTTSYGMSTSGSIAR